MLTHVLETNYYLGDTYTGVIATPQLVGRADILASVLNEIQNKKQSTIIYMTGPGGVGKTRLLKHILATVAPDSSLLVAKDLIDLYHVRNRSIGGLIQSLLDLVEPIGKLVKDRPQGTNVDEKLDELSRAEQEGLSAAELISRREELTKTLVDLVNQQTQHKRLVLALDTAERLFVTPDEAQLRLGLNQHRPAILEWLLNGFLPKLENSVILIAGRPEPLNLTAELHSIAQTTNQHFVPLTVKGLTGAEALEYFASVIQRAETSSSASDQQAASAIRGWSENERRTIFHCLHNGEGEPRIRPILLALAIDHLVVAGRPLPALVRPLDEAVALNNQERRTIEEQLGKALVQNLHEFRRPADDLILTLGWLRKGADVQLLSELTDIRETEVTVALAQIRDLSFVKIRPSDQRLFLHDEMYELLQRYSTERRAPTERQRIFNKLQTYYELQIQQSRKQIDELYRPQADTFQETLPNPIAVRDARARLQDAMVEDFYYRLRWSPTEAFQKYVLYVAEALNSNDENLWLLLRAELFGFLAERDPQGIMEEIEGLRRVDVVADSAVRWLIWLWSQERYSEAIQVADRLAGLKHELIEPSGLIAQAHLNAWSGYLNVFAGNYEKAEQLLTSSLDLLNQWTTTHKRNLRWASILARAFNSLGYLYSTQTRHYEAIEFYASAHQLWERVKLPVQEAQTLNNRAFSMAKIGRFHVATPLATRALHLREQMGPRVPVGLSINTLALIQLADYDMAGALRDGQRAYEIFRRINSHRGQGLALTVLAEAKRRTSTSATNLQQGISAELLSEALEHATEAVQIFSEKVLEPRRKVEALRELGRIYRDWAKLRREHPNIISSREARDGKATPEMLAQYSEATFQEALILAQNNILLFIDLKISLAKLYYYTQFYVGAPNYLQAQLALEQGLLTEIESLIPVDYHIPPTVGSTLPKDWSVVQAGGLALLRGHISLNRWYSEQADSQWLSNAIQHYTISLAHYDHFSNYIFQEVREAQDQIYDQLNLLTTQQKRSIYAIAEKTEHQYSLGAGESRMSRFLYNRFGKFDLDLSDLDL